MSCKSGIFLAAALASALLYPACSRSGQPSPQLRRLAVLPVDDQSPSASHAWLARLLSFALVRQIEGAPRLLAAEVRNAADLPGATHQLAGFLSLRGGNVEAHLFLYELPSHKLVRHEIIARPAADWLSLLSGAARFVASALEPSASLQPVSVEKESAARRLAEALSASTPEQSQAAFRAAAEDDPSCGWCWLGWAETALRRGLREEALQAVSAFSLDGGQIDRLSRSRLDLIAAQLRSDPLATAAAYQAIAAAAPGDPVAQGRLAEVLVANRQFDQAAAALQRAISIDPRNGLYWNSLAYAHAYAGRFEDSLKAIARYAELDSSPNPADSRGEILMMAGRFTEACQAFEESYRRDRNFNNGAAMEKAALCWMLHGDPRRASEAIARFLQDRAEAGDRFVELRRARWEFLVGQSALARQRWGRLAGDSTSPVHLLASSMLALRQAFADPASAASILRSRPPARDPMHELFFAYAAAAGDPSFPDQIRDERLKLELRALSLTARRDWSRAADAWKTVIDRSPGGTDSPYRELRAFCLVQTGNTRQASEALGDSWPLLSQGQWEFYDFLVYPNALFTRAEIARASGRTDEARRLYDIFLQFAGDRPDLAPQIARARSAARL